LARERQALEREKKALQRDREALQRDREALERAKEQAREHDRKMREIDKQARDRALEQERKSMRKAMDRVREDLDRAKDALERERKKPPGPPGRAALDVERKVLEQLAVQLHEQLANLLKRENEVIDGFLSKVDVARKTVSITLRGTRLRVEAIPLARDVQVFLDQKKCGLDELRVGMPVALRLTDPDSGVVGVVKARGK
jgi:hypothetical protein